MYDVPLNEVIKKNILYEDFVKSEPIINRFLKQLIP